MEPMVSICCLVYNHEPYLRKTLEGFVNQKTDFAYEILIHDDASTDNSAGIIREYCEKYPDLFRPILQTENQHSKKIPVSRTYLYPLARGKYVALCEGDDYWCDENKLQQQVDYMEAHPDCSMCVHDTQFIDHEGNRLCRWHNGIRRDRDYNVKQIIRADGGGLFHTSSVLGRNHVITQRPETYRIPRVGDLPTAIYAGECGYIHYIGKVMSCYRFGHPGSWTVRTTGNMDRMLDQCESDYQAFTRLDRETGYKHTGAYRVLRGKRLLTLYRRKYGLLKLFINPGDLAVVLWSCCYTVPKKWVRKYHMWRNTRKGSAI